MNDGAKFEVTVNVNYDDITFDFDTLNEARAFSELALKSAQPKEYGGKTYFPEIIIKMTPIEIKKNEEDN